MEAKAIARFVRIGPRKVGQVLDLIRMKSVTDSVNILNFTPKAACEVVMKVLLSSVANLRSKKDHGDIYIAEAYVTPGPALKRMRPMAMGRAGTIKKYMSHVTIVVTDEAKSGMKKKKKKKTKKS
ncbi:MAG: 50S ribosomal protein L22 [bacterium]